MTPLTCRDVAEFLSDYLARELPIVEIQSFEAHLLHCDECVVYIRQYAEAVRLGRDAFCDGGESAAEVPPQLVDAVLAARRQR